VQVGIRSLTRDEEELSRSHPAIETVFARDIVERPAREWAGRVASGLGRDVYVTVDVDGLDPSIMPSTGTPEPEAHVAPARRPARGRARGPTLCWCRRRGAGADSGPGRPRLPGRSPALPPDGARGPRARLGGLARMPHRETVSCGSGGAGRDHGRTCVAGDGRG
jgi:hypothetical protein